MSTDMFMPAPAKGPGRIGQGTAVEQARASTEVQGAIYIARQFPRDVEAARQRMLMACAQPELAEKAFYSYPRGGEEVTGLTIDAACELAVCWGNFEYGLTEMRRDDEYGQSESMAWSWDLETNVRTSNTFIAPHIREGKGGVGKRVTNARDVYEVITNYGNRRMRAAILKNLPRWYRIQAENAFRETLKRMVDGSEKPFAQQLAQALADFKDRYGVTADQLAHKAGKPLDKWTTNDLVQLRILWNSLDRGDVTAEEAFPDAKVTAEEILASAAPVATRESVGPDGHILHDPDRWESGCPGCQSERAASFAAAEAPEHTDHDPNEITHGCPGCAFDSAEANRKEREQ